MRRGEVWWADLPQPVGSRPVLLLSRDLAYEVRTSVTVAAVTTKVRNIPVEVPLGPNDGMSKECVVNLDAIATVPKDLLLSRLTALSHAKMRDAEKAICFALGMKSR